LDDFLSSEGPRQPSPNRRRKQQKTTHSYNTSTASSDSDKENKSNLAPLIASKHKEETSNTTMRAEHDENHDDDIWGELSEMELLHINHLQRRAARSCHSGGPMYLSKKASYLHILATRANPSVSSVKAMPLNFSLKATTIDIHNHPARYQISRKCCINLLARFEDCVDGDVAMSDAMHDSGPGRTGCEEA
jgi:hypothetical protein